jgi:hypothetical protein
MPFRLSVLYRFPGSHTPRECVCIQIVWRSLGAMTLLLWLTIAQPRRPPRTFGPTFLRQERTQKLVLFVSPLLARIGVLLTTVAGHALATRRTSWPTLSILNRSMSAQIQTTTHAGEDTRALEFMGQASAGGKLTPWQHVGRCVPQT